MKSSKTIVIILSMISLDTYTAATVYAQNPHIVYSTYLGGSNKDNGRGVVVDMCGNAYVTGCTRSTNFPVTPNAFDTTFNRRGSDQWAWGNSFFLVMNSAGSRIENSIYYGGSNDEEAYGITIDTSGDVYLCGVTSSSDFPTTPGSYDRSFNGGYDVYITKFSFDSQMGIKTGNNIPSGFELIQNYPNPFNPKTIIRYLLMGESDVRIKIYDMLGREIAALVHETKPAGEHFVEWNGKNSAGVNVSNGMYFCTLSANNQIL